MPTLFHAPQSRSSRIVSLIDELGVADSVDIRTVSIPRMDGSGGPDAGNPHPDKKVPLLVDGNTTIWETIAITLYLTDMFPQADLGPVVGDADRGAYLGWLAYYAAVVEPVFVMEAAGLNHPILQDTFRGRPEMTHRLADALRQSPYLLGDRYSAADLILASPFGWFPDATPDVPGVRDWVARCQGRDSVQRTMARDAQWMAKAA